MTGNETPDGWDEHRVQRVLTHYEGQTATEAGDEDDRTAEGAIEPPSDRRRECAGLR